MVRTDAVNGPDPAALVVSATTFVAKPDGQILLVQRADTGRWGLPGGYLGAGERISDIAVRRTREETGVDVLLTGLIGVYSHPRHAPTRGEFSLCFRAHPLGGDPRPRDSSAEVRWFRPDGVTRLNIQPETLLRIGHALTNRLSPYLG